MNSWIFINLHKRLINTVTNVFLTVSSCKVNKTLRKKGTKAVTGAVPFQKVNFCPF